MPDEYKVTNDPVQAYRNYYVGEKHFAMKLGRRLHSGFFAWHFSVCKSEGIHTCFHTQNHDVEIILSPPKSEILRL